MTDAAAAASLQRFFDGGSTWHVVQSFEADAQSTNN